MRNSVLNGIFCAIVIFIFPVLVISQIRESTNYKIERDSINIGGGYSTSTNYTTEDTIGETATGYSTSTNYSLQAGYQQFEETFITISSPADVSMSSISGLTGGTSTGSAEWTVTTNNAAGYSLSIKATSSPAMTLDGGVDYFADYTTAGAAPDYNFSVDATAAEFAYSVEGDDTADRFLDNGSACNTGTGNVADKCWDAFSTSNTTIAETTGSNDPTGTATTVKLQAESGSNKILSSGVYEATLIVTGLAL